MNNCLDLTACAGKHDRLTACIDRHAQALFLVLVSRLALAIRWCLLPIESGDFQDWLRPWYDRIATEGFAAFRERYHNYSMLYMYFLYGMVKLGIPALYGIKAVSIVGDFVLAAFACKTLLLLSGSRLRANLCYALMLFCPTIVLNGAAWGQCDSIFTACLLASLFFLIRRRFVAALLCYGLSFAFKLQAIFVLPVYLSLALSGVFPLHYLLWGLGIYVIAHLPPVLLVGAKPKILLWEAYRGQIGANGQNLTMNAPSIWAFVSNKLRDFNKAAPFLGLGLVLTASFAAHVSRAVQRNVLVAMTFFALFVPYVLPRMHERYFFIADVLSILYACRYPNRFYVPLLVVLASLLAYGPFLMGFAPIPMTVLALPMGLATAVVGVDVWRAAQAEKPAEPAS